MAKSRPLAGQRILVGRARHQASALSASLRKLGAEVIEIPFIEIRKPASYRPLDDALRNVANYDWLILTSVNGVEALWNRLRRSKFSKKVLAHLRIAAIGPATKSAIESHGLKVHVAPEQYVAESVVESLRDSVSGRRVLLARAKVARDVIPRELRKLGAKVDVVEAYETVVPKRSRARLLRLLNNPKRQPRIVTFTSSSTAKNFVALLGKSKKNQAWLETAKLASIGPVTSATLRELGLRVDIEAGQYNIPGLVKAIAASVRE